MTIEERINHFDDIGDAEVVMEAIMQQIEDMTELKSDEEDDLLRWEIMGACLQIIGAKASAFENLMMGKIDLPSMNN